MMVNSEPVVQLICCLKVNLGRRFFEKNCRSRWHEIYTGGGKVVNLNLKEIWGESQRQFVK